jgi:hypothetical protein
MARRFDPDRPQAWQHCSTLGLSRDTSTPRHRHIRTAAYLREPGIRPLCKVSSADCSGRGQRRETRKLRRSGRREVSVVDACLSLGNHPDRNTTDAVYASSFEYRATLFQRLFASPSDFDLVCREFLADGDQSGL